MTRSVDAECEFKRINTNRIVEKLHSTRKKTHSEIPSANLVHTKRKTSAREMHSTCPMPFLFSENILAMHESHCTHTHITKYNNIQLIQFCRCEKVCVRAAIRLCRSLAAYIHLYEDELPQRRHDYPCRSLGQIFNIVTKKKSTKMMKKKNALNSAICARNKDIRKPRMKKKKK